MSDNVTLNETLDEDPEDPALFAYPAFFTYVLFSLYILVFIFGLIGNTLVFYTIHYTNPRMKTVQNYFLANLALGDLLIIVVCIPTSIIDFLWQYWPFGSILCHLLSPVQAIGVFVSSYTLVALAVDRYLAILYPLKLGLRRGQARGIIGLVWVGAILTAVPVAVNSRLEVHENSGSERCGEYAWSNYTHEIIYSLTLLFLQYLFPVAVMIFTYARISIVVWGGRNRSQRGQASSFSSHFNNKGKRKTVVLSLLVVGLYTVSWLPYNIIYMVYNNGPEFIRNSDTFPYVFIACHFLAMAHSTFNPVTYFWINSRFRKAFIQVLVIKCPGVGKVLDGFIREDGSGHGSSFRRGVIVGGTPGGAHGTRTLTIIEEQRNDAVVEAPKKTKSNVIQLGETKKINGVSTRV